MIRQGGAAAIFPAVVVTAALLTFTACGDDDREALPSEPSSDAEGPVVAHATPDAPSSQRRTDGGEAPDTQSGVKRFGVGTPAFAITIVDDDSTYESCNSGEFCAIQGDSAGGTVGVQCTGSATVCATARYRPSLQNPPPATTTTFTPETLMVNQPGRISIKTDSATPARLYQPTLVFTPIGNSPPVSTLPVKVRVLCSFKYNKCPILEILDLGQIDPVTNDTPVVSAPAPQQRTLIGKPLKLLMRHKKGTGEGEHTLSNWQWNGSGTVVKSYDLANGRLTPLDQNSLKASTLSLYWVKPSTPQTYSASATATLTRTSDGKVFQPPAARARYEGVGPTAVTMTSQTYKVRVGVYDPGNTAIDSSTGEPLVDLSFGTRDSVGITFRTFRAVGPKDNDGTVNRGYVAGTQLIRSSPIFTLVPGASYSGVEFPSTNGAYHLDNCATYFSLSIDRPDPTTAEFQWEATDAPKSTLLWIYSAVTRDDAFQMYFMYRPDAEGAIWVPIGRVDWFWWGRSERTSFSGPNNGWSDPVKFVTSDWLENPTGFSYELFAPGFPQWTDTLVNPGAPLSCAIVP
jgi:hypothetical protein